jgi:hypothetical protein
LLERLRQQLLAGWPAGGHQRLATAATGHALHFRTWRSLVRVQGLTTPEAVTLMARLVEQAAARGRPAPGSGTVQAGRPATH